VTDPGALFLPTGAASLQRCDQCGATWPEGAAAPECPDCGGLLAIIHGRPSWDAVALRAAFAADSAGPRPESPEAPGVGSGVWRYRPLVMPGATRVISWPEGNTPLVARDAVRAYAGVASLHLKHEGMNPTGSFKDRGMTVAVTQAVRAGAQAVACASTGNTAASLAAYGAAAGLKTLVFVPRGKVSTGKMAQSLAYGARTLSVDGDFDACLALARAASRELGVYLANSVNPWRLEGQKTIVWELLQQRDWNAPDWIALPAGALGNTSAFGKALREARALGLIARVPRLLAVQAAGAAPFAHGYAAGFATRTPVRAETVATAIRIGDPVSWDRAVRAIRETDGVVCAVDDAAILDAKAVVDAAGVGCEPASAASVAGVRAMVAAGVIAADADVVAVLTGHLLKDPETVAGYHVSNAARANPPIEVGASLADVERVLAPEG
jgi:threonine synthase